MKSSTMICKVNYRNHRKIVVIDGRIGFVGGMNLAERYMRGFSWGIWRDTHLLLEGKAVHGLQTAFLLDWYFVDRTLITSEMEYVAESYFGDELSFFCDEVSENEFHVEVKKNGSEVVCRSKVIFE